MITWMQRHKKYLIITIWISTIAFVGAGFVGWGQYSYGDKAGAVAKVGNVEVSMGELQKSYSRLFTQYNQMFEGKFDEEKAKIFGLQKQALQQLTNQALILNLASSYSLIITDEELLTNLQAQEYFFKDGIFDKSIYKETLTRNNINAKEYENDLRKQLLIQKVLELLPIEENQAETNIMNSVLSIADKIKYTILNDINITVDMSDSNIQEFWKIRQNEFLTDKSYTLKYIEHKKVVNTYTQAEIVKYYEANKNHFKNIEGKISTLKDANELVINELNEKSNKTLALKGFLAYKKKKLADDLVQKVTLSQTNNIFNKEILDKISELSITSPYIKIIQMDGIFYTFELLSINPAQIKTFEQAKESIRPLYMKTRKTELLHKKAESLLNNFEGITTDFITVQDSMSLSDMSTEEAKEFSTQLFNTQKKIGIITLANGKVVLYNILEQKMLNIVNTKNDNSILQLKSSLFTEGLIKLLEKEYATEIFIEGL